MQRKELFQIEVTSLAQSKDFALEATLEYEVVDHPPPMLKELELEIHQEEPIISRHALFDI